MELPQPGVARETSPHDFARSHWHVTQHGRREVVDADLRDYFTSIPHSPLMHSLSRRIADGRLLRTIMGRLTAPVVEIIDGRAVQADLT